MKSLKVKDDTESLIKDFCRRLSSFESKLLEEKKAEIEELHSYFISNGIIADVFSIVGEPLNIL